MRSDDLLAEGSASIVQLIADSSVVRGTMRSMPNDGLDDVDRRLLELLADDARMSNARLAA